MCSLYPQYIHTDCPKHGGVLSACRLVDAAGWPDKLACNNPACRQIVPGDPVLLVAGEGSGSGSGGDGSNSSSGDSGAGGGDGVNGGGGNEINADNSNVQLAVASQAAPLPTVSCRFEKGEFGFEDQSICFRSAVGAVSGP